jgi:hypothetical protein
MKTTTALSCIGLLLALSACSPATSNAQTNAPAVVAAPEPTATRLTERIQGRWATIVKNDWIAAFEFLSPEQKRHTGLSKYLQNKEHHKYENPRVAQVVAITGKEAYAQVFALWTPVHDRIGTIDNLAPGQTLTQDVEFLETWRWAEGDWTYVRAQRPEDFYKDHPELLRAEPAKTGQSAEPARPVETAVLPGAAPAPGVGK